MSNISKYNVLPTNTTPLNEGDLAFLLNGSGYILTKTKTWVEFTNGIKVTQVDKDNWYDAYNKRHTHPNKDVLDIITLQSIDEWDTAYSQRHTHTNKDVLDTISSTDITNWNSGIRFNGVLGASDNLDNFKTNGVWNQPSNSNATTSNKYPDVFAGNLFVWGDGSTHIVQEYVTYSARNDKFRRYFYAGAWSDWTKSWDSNDFGYDVINNWNASFGWGDHALAGYLTNATGDQRYLRLVGGTMTGDINTNSKIVFTASAKINEITSAGWKLTNTVNSQVFTTDFINDTLWGIRNGANTVLTKDTANNSITLGSSTNTPLIKLLFANSTTPVDTIVSDSSGTLSKVVGLPITTQYLVNKLSTDLSNLSTDGVHFNSINSSTANRPVNFTSGTSITLNNDADSGSQLLFGTTSADPSVYFRQKFGGVFGSYYRIATTNDLDNLSGNFITKNQNILPSNSLWNVTKGTSGVGVISNTGNIGIFNNGISVQAIDYNTLGTLRVETGTSTKNPAITFNKTDVNTANLVYNGGQDFFFYNHDNTGTFYTNALGYKKTGSSDDYFLTGGGGHKPVSDFATSTDLSNYVTINTHQTIIADKNFAPTSNVKFLGIDANHINVFRSEDVYEIVSGHEYTHYNTSWKVGNKRGGNTDSIGFSFQFSSDGGATYDEIVLIQADGNILTSNFGAASDWNAKVSQSQLSDYVNKSGDTMTGQLNALTISAQNPTDRLIYDNLENYGSPLKINANADLGIYLQANYTNIMYVGPSNVNIDRNLHINNSEIYTTSHGGSANWKGAYDFWQGGNYLAERGWHDDANVAKTDSKNSVTNWVSGTGFYGTYGTSLHIQGANSWYQRLDFSTDGEKIEYWQGINTSVMTKKGYLPIIPDGQTVATTSQLSNYWSKSELPDYRNYGLGRSQEGATNYNLNNIAETSILGINNTTTSTPSGMEWGSVWTHRKSATEFTQHVVDVITGQSYTRGWSAGFGDTGWRKHWDNVNLNPVRIGGSDVNDNPIYLGWTGEQLQIQVDNSVIGNIWHTSNLDPVTVNTPQDITAHKTFAGATGNDYIGSAIMINGNGSANTIYPTLAFHQPSAYAGTISYRGNGFYFMNINGNGFDYVRTAGFVKEGSSNDYLLLGGGSHKHVSDFATSADLSNVVTIHTPQTIIADKTFAPTSNVNFLGSESNHVSVVHSSLLNNIVSGLTYSWYDTVWNVGSKRGSGVGSEGYAFQFSSNGGATYDEKVLITYDGNILTSTHGAASDWNAKVSQSQLLNYVDLSTEQNIVGIKNYTNYSRWIQDGDSNTNALGVIQSTDSRFVLGTFNTKPTTLYYNGGVKVWIDASLTTFTDNIAIPNATQNDHAVNLGQLNSQIGNYLPLSGGTLTGNINTYAFDSGIDTLGTYFEGNSDVGIRIQYYNNNNVYHTLAITDVLKFDNNIVWHEGIMEDYHLYGLGSYSPNASVNIDTPKETGFYNIYPNITSGNVPFAFANLLHMSYMGTTEFSQIAVQKGGENISFRTDSTPWRKMYHEGNFNPDTKVNKAGDTMTGGLVVDTLNGEGSNNLGILPTNYKLFLANNGSRYGTVHWVEGNGQGYIQQQRADDNPTAYRLNLQPYGGELFYGNSEVATTTWASSNFSTLASPQTFTATKTFSVSPIIPNASLPVHPVNLGQLSGILSSGYVKTDGNGRALAKGFIHTDYNNNDYVLTSDGGVAHRSEFGGQDVKYIEVNNGDDFRPTEDGTHFNVFARGGMKLYLDSGTASYLGQVVTVYNNTGAQLQVWKDGSNVATINGNKTTRFIKTGLGWQMTDVGTSQFI